ncbi:hypothetical protein LY90DRAFT_634880 [Neocallimastix californiae]|uniref:Uncharacterized protein n=1 Tax=Neocallimastix californiae TaxID=1754190 RepID=A0A1Y2ABE5_9FUNG|nr:hypothetical protein LY90DRAFT_634880 [Neocallimastix californiae]|eukprot:ORY19335.1 hypothetical protein LY90DRAFT_634880 [Neocallimastix californiae]
MDLRNILLYNDQSIIQSKMNSLYMFMFTISLNTLIHPIIGCILYFIKAYIGLDVDFKIFRIISLVLNLGFLAMIMIISLTHAILKTLPSKNGSLATFPGIPFLKEQHYLIAGMWTMILGTTIIDLIAFIFKTGKSFFGIMLIIVGAISFFIGIGLFRYLYTKHINEIYKRFKAKKIENNQVKSFSESQSTSSTSKNENIDEKLISIDSSNSDNEYSEEEKENDENNSNSSYNSEDSNSIILDDKISERITSFGLLKEIINERISNESVVIFKSINDFELACRFICIKQFGKNPYLYTYYSYYLIYMEERKVNIGNQEIESNNNESEILESESDQNNKMLDNMKEEFDNNNYNDLLGKAITFKLNPWGKYFVIFLIFYLNEKEKENVDYYCEKEAKENLIHLQNKAIENHHIILDLFKMFYNYIILSQKNSSDLKYFNIDKLFESLSYLKHEAIHTYQEIIEKYPNDKVSYQLYSLFLKDVMKFALNEGESYIGLNSSNRILKGNSESKLLGSTASFGMSKSVKSSTVSDTESKKKRNLNIVYCFLFLRGFNQNIKDLKLIGDMSYNINNLLRHSRIIGFFLMENDVEEAENLRTTILDTVDILDTKYIPVLVKHSLDKVSNTPVTIYFDVDGTLKSTYSHFNGYELMKNIIIWSKNLYSTQSEELINRAENGTSIFNDYRYRMFSDNIKDGSYNKIMIETFKKIYEEAKNYQDNKIIVIYILVIIMIIASFIINVFGN